MSVLNIKVSNMTGNSGRAVPNQMIIQGEDENGPFELFQSYKSIIAKRQGGQVTLDEYYWDYSVTTGRYRNEFLGENIDDTRKAIKSGVYKLADLN